MISASSATMWPSRHTARKRRHSQTAQSLHASPGVMSHPRKTTKSLAVPNLSWLAPPRTFSLWSRTRKICDDRWLGIRSIRRRQTCGPGATQNLLLLPRACQSSRLCLHSICTLISGRSYGKEKSFSNSTCEGQIKLAERELSAFILAVTKLFGSEQAKLSAEDWVDELKLLHSLHRATSRDWCVSSHSSGLVSIDKSGNCRSEIVERLQHRLIQKFCQYYRPIVSQACLWSDVSWLPKREIILTMKGHRFQL